MISHRVAGGKVLRSACEVNEKNFFHDWIHYDVHLKTKVSYNEPLKLAVQFFFAFLLEL